MILFVNFYFIPCQREILISYLLRISNRRGGKR